MSEKPIQLAPAVPPAIVAEVVSVLESALAEAKAGKFHSVVVLADGGRRTYWQRGGSQDLPVLLFAMEQWKASVLRACEVADEEGTTP